MASLLEVVSAVEEEAGGRRCDECVPGQLPMSAAEFAGPLANDDKKGN